VSQSPNLRGADIVGEVQRDPTTAPAGVAPDYARLGKAVSHLEELVAGNLQGEVCEGGWCVTVPDLLYSEAFSLLLHTACALRQADLKTLQPRS
jgi:hypothetical protein